MTYPCIIVERPHQRPAIAWACFSPNLLVNLALNAWFKTDGTEPEPLDEETALAFLGHDLHCLTVLESAAEAERYVLDDSFHGSHNKGIDSVLKAASDLDWYDEEEEGDADLDWASDIRARFARAETIPIDDNQSAVEGSWGVA